MEENSTLQNGFHLQIGGLAPAGSKSLPPEKGLNLHNVKTVQQFESRCNSPVLFFCDHLLPLGAAVFVAGCAAAKHLYALVAEWAVEAGTPPSLGVHIARTVGRTQHHYKLNIC